MISNPQELPAPAQTLPTRASAGIAAEDVAVLRAVQREEIRLAMKAAQHKHEEGAARHSCRAAALTRILLVASSQLRNE